ncbi:MFS transporter [Candidatus Bathyarchaeota archaeon]|nr:MFS transporter [Candidatus Bathyarchaeota archaeon]
MGAFAGGVVRSTEKDRVYLIAVGLLFVELLAGVVWGIQRGLSSLFAKEVLMIASFTQIGMVTSVFGLTKAVTNLFMGALSDRVGRKPVIVVGAIVSALGGMVIASADQFTGMLLGTALIGLGGGSTFVGIMVAMTEVIPSRIGLAMGLFQLAAYGGSTLGTSLAGYLAVSYGLRQPFTVLMAISAVGAVAGFFFIPKTNGSVHGERTRPKMRVSITSYAKRLAPMYFAGFSSKIMDSLVVSFLPLYLTGLGMDIGRVATVMSAFTFSWALLQPVTGHTSDRIGRKRIIVVGLAGSVISVVTFTLTGSFTLLIVCSLLLGAGAALFYTPLVAMVSDIAPSELEGTLIGSYRFFRDLGYFVGPLLLGTIADNLGLANAFYATSLILLVATLAIQLLAEETVERAS